MKKIFQNTALFISILFMSFGLQAQDYNFVISGTVTDSLGNGISNQLVTIQYAGTNVDAWTIGGGTYSADLDISADNTVAIVSTYAEGCGQTYSDTVVMNQGGQAQVDFELCVNDATQCNLMFYYTNSPANDLAVEFNALIEGADTTSFTWDFGDGETSTEANPTHIYADYGVYDVTLTSNNSYCGTLTYNDFVYLIEDTTAGCYADFGFEFEEGQYGYYPVNFIDYSYSETGISSWAWNFGDGTTSNEQNPSHIYSEEGQYLVTLTIESGDVCSTTTEYYVWVGENQWYPEDCQALFYTEYNNNDYLSVNFVDLSVGGNQAQIQAWQWSFGDGTGSSDQNPAHTYTADGEYVVTLTIFTDSCSSTFKEMVYIEDWSNPSGDCQAFFYPEFDTLSTSVQFYDLTMPNATNWDWTFGDGATSTEQNPVHVYAQIGTYTVSLTAGSDTCSSTFEMEINLAENQQGNKTTTYIGTIVRAYAVHGNTTGVEAISKENIFTLYPNPVKNVLNINFKENTNARIEIISITGQVVKRLETTNAKTVVNTHNLPKGVYFARINVNGTTYTQKFVK